MELDISKIVSNLGIQIANQAVEIAKLAALNEQLKDQIKLLNGKLAIEEKLDGE